MKRWIFTAALLMAARPSLAQDADALVRSIEQGSPAEVADAEAALIRMGPAADPAVRRRLPEVPRPSWIILDRILEQIETAERRRRFRAVDTRISLKIDNKPFNEAASELEKIAGVPLPLPDRFKNPVTVDLKDVSPLEAFDRAITSADLSWYGEWKYNSPRLVPSVVLRALPEPDSRAQVLYVKGFRIAFSGLTIQRQRTPTSDVTTAWIGAGIQPLPGAGHVMLDELRIAKIDDDRGTVLHESDPKAAPKPPRPQRLAGAASPLGGIPLNITVKPPDPTARTYSIRGAVARIRGEVGRRHVALETAETAFGKKVEFEGLKLTLWSVSKADGRVVVGVEQSGQRRPAESSDSEIEVEGRQLEFAVLRLRDGTTVHPERVNRPKGKPGVVEHVYVTAGEPAEIRFITYTVWLLETLSFELLDQPIADR